MLPILADNYGVDLMGEHQDLAETLSQHSGDTIFLFTYKARESSGKLEPALFDPTRLRAEYEAFNGLGFDRIGEIMLEGVKFLRSGIEQLASGTIGILSIA